MMSLSTFMRSAAAQLAARTQTGPNSTDPLGIDAESLRSTFRHFVILSPICIFAAIYLYAQVEVVPEDSYTLEWVVLVVCYHFVRTALGVVFTGKPQLDAVELRRWDRIALTLQFFDGLHILLFALFIWPFYPFVEQLIQLMTVMLVVAGTSFTLAGRWRTIMASAPMTYLGFAWSAQQIGHVYAEAISVMVLVFFGLYLLSARSQHRSNVQGLELARELDIKNQELQEVASQRSRLLATVSHDLRQPSHAIGLLCEQAMLDPNPASLKDSLRDLNELSQSLGASLTTLMDLTRLDAGLVRANLLPVPLHQVLLRVEAEFGGSARNKGLSLSVPRSPLWVRTDPVLLHGVLANLVSNAIKYTRAGQVSVDLQRQGDEITVAVCDTGMGIREDKLDLIFREFVRLESPESGTEGLGLGLSIVKRYASLMGHAVQVESTPSVGSRFSIRLPLVASEAGASADAQAPGAAPGDQRLSGLQVLVVDNVDLVLSSMVRTLTGWGCGVHAARCLADARELAAHHHLDLVISDFHLGDEEPDGLALIQALRAQDPQRNPRLPALLMTGDVSGQLEAQARRDHVGILHKPVRPAVLRDRLHRWLQAPQDEALPKPAQDMPSDITVLGGTRP